MAKLDKEMASVYAWLMGQVAPDARGELASDQSAWLQQRNRCRTNDGCIKDALYKSMAYLNEYLMP